MTPAPSSDRVRLETILMPRPRCPRCGEVRLARYRSDLQREDGTALCWVRCRNADCGYRFRVQFF